MMQMGAQVAADPKFTAATPPNSSPNSSVKRRLLDPKLAELNTSVLDTAKAIGTPDLKTVNEKIGQITSDRDTSFTEKYQNTTFGKDFGSWSAGLSTVGKLSGMLPGSQNTFNGPEGDIRAGIQKGWDAASNAVANFGPYGQIASLAMKATNVLNNVQGAIFGATDGMTTTDAIMDSPLGFLTGVGWANQAFGDNADTITKDTEIFSKVGSSYGGSESAVNDALDKSGKKYGAFSWREMNKANAQIREAKRQQNVVRSISDIATDRFTLKEAMSGINNNKRAFQLQGGYDQRNIRVGKEGTVLELSNEDEDILSGFTYKPAPKEDIENFEYKKPFSYKKAIKYDEDIEYIPENPDAIIEYVNKHNKVNWVRRLKDSFREYIPDWEFEGNKVTHKLAYVKDRGKIKVFPVIQELDGELYDFSDPKYEHEKYDVLDSADKNNDIVIFDNEDDAKWFTKHYEEFYPTFDKYAKGGKFNIIPEGALHARKHNLDIDGITKKGIPVVSESEDGKIEQQAEIEHSEIIFRLEVTEQIEECRKKYEETKDDSYAIEIGKLLTKEILYNTDDRTNLINQV